VRTTLCRLIRSLLISEAIWTHLLMEVTLLHKRRGLKVLWLLLGPTTIILLWKSINQELDLCPTIIRHNGILLDTGMVVVLISVGMVTIIIMGVDVIMTVGIRTGVITAILMVETTICLQDLFLGLLGLHHLILLNYIHPHLQCDLLMVLLGILVRVMFRWYVLLFMFMVW